MKFKNCYIDKVGNIWKDSTLIGAAKDIDTKDFIITEGLIETILQWKLITVRDYIAHYRRVQNCDISIPIVLHPNGTIMDGWHRVIRAYCEGKQLCCKQLTILPEPDFKDS